MAKNANLSQAKRGKNDEFYTQLSDIENEILGHYEEHFKGKVVYCNCDDPYESNFFKFFVLNFEKLGLKKLISTCYEGSPISGCELSLFDDTLQISQKTAYKIEIAHIDDLDKNGVKDLADIKIFLEKNPPAKLLSREREREREQPPRFAAGDFRSGECVELLKEADIVVTNPPFSLFREYVAQLIEFDKKFLIIGSANAITYKEIFKLFMDNKIWLGFGFKGGNAYFYTPNPREFASGVFDEKTGLVKFRNSIWLTNLNHSKRHEFLMTIAKFDPQIYPKYDNYDAINVNKTAEIPLDYNGVMGVPITFLDKYNPEQFEILGIDRYIADNPNYGKRFSICNKEIYARILIKNKKVER